MIHYNIDCDFKIAEQLIADAPFRYTYYVKNVKTVVVEYDGTDYHGCYPMGDMLIVPINAGSLGLGEVKVRREYYLTDKDFTDGICNRVTGNVPLGIEIWRGETDGMETHEVKVVPAYQKGDPFTFDDMTDAQKQDIANRVPTKEPEREQAEAKREQNELLRQAKEAERETKEAERQSIFSTNEAERQRIFETNEAIRQENESKRVEAEILRQEAETIREATYKNKVDRDDNAPKLTAGFANNLVGRGEATPQEISFRPSGGDTSIEDGTARIERVKGSTVVWNQLVNEWNLNHGGLTISHDGAKATINGTTSSEYLWFCRSSTITVGHKGLIRLHIIKGGDILEGLLFGLINKTNVRNVIKDGYANVFYTSDDTFPDYLSCGILRISKGVEFQDVVLTVNSYDLTQMFGAGNEPTTIEEFHASKPLGIDEYTYNEGELISNNVEELKSVGFNAWDEEWVNGYFNPTGNWNDEQIVSSKNPIPVLEGKTYYCLNKSLSSTYATFWRDYTESGKTSTGMIGERIGISNNVFTVPLGAKYMHINCGSEYGTTYKNDICIHLAHTGYRNGEYEPYKEFRRNVPIKDIKDKDGNQLFPNGLLSAGSVYDEITATKAIKRIGVVDMGTLNWGTRSGSTFKIESDIVDSLNMARYADTMSPNNMVCSKYPPAPTYEMSGLDKVFRGPYEKTVYNGEFNLKDSEYTDPKALKASLQGVMLYYELAEPIEVDLPEPLNLDYEVSDFGTEEVISDVPTTPMKADIIYQFNAVDRIRDNSRHTAEAEIKLKDYETRIAALEAIVTSLTSGES